MNQSRLLLAAILAGMLGTVHAQAAKDVKVLDAWVRTSVPGASVSAAYMHIKSKTALKLVKAESPLAGMTEIHQMSMKDGVMSMGEVAGIDIPPNKLVDLKPGGLHIMLMQLKQPIQKGTEVPITLTFEDASKKRQVLEIKAKAQEKDSGTHRH
jgi:copper(I)-binding protein